MNSIWKMHFGDYSGWTNWFYSKARGMYMKIQATLIVPAIGAAHNVLLPASLKIKDMLPLLIKGAIELSNNGYVSSNEEFLCLAPLDLPLNPDGTLLQYGVQNGDYLYLI